MRIKCLKGQCHEIFFHFFISLIEAIWAPNEQSKIVLLKSSFSRRYSQNQWLRAVLACAESDSPQANTARSRIFCEFLRENKLLSKTILACLSGAQMASIHEIKNAKKSRDTAPLSCQVISYTH